MIPSITFRGMLTVVAEFLLPECIEQGSVQSEAGNAAESGTLGMLLWETRDLS